MIAAALFQIGYDVVTRKLSMGVLGWALTLSVCSLGIALRSPVHMDRRPSG